ncbi:MAG: ATP-binding protein [Bacteroidales bacterium]
MMKIINNYIIILITIIISVGCGVVLFMIDNRLYILCGVILIWLIVKIINIYNEPRRRFEYLVDALNCNDFTINFYAEDNSVNEMLNKIRDLVAVYKDKTIEQERYYKLIFDNLNIGILIINERGGVTQVNNGMYTILGLDVITHINQIADISVELANSILNVEPSEPQQVVIKNSLITVTLLITTSYIKHSDQKLKLILVSNMESALERRDSQAWSKLIRVLTHEIMNSLAPIRSLSDALILLNRDEDINQHLITINQTSKSLISYVHNFRYINSITRVNKAPFEVKPLLNKLISLSCSEDINVTVNLNPSDIMLFADENLVLQVLLNILKNSVQATECRSDKRISVDGYIREDESVIIEISNNGCEIDGEVVKNLFLPFFTTKADGKGVGLNISKQIMELHGGLLSLTVNEPERVTFTLVFK